MMGHNIRLNEKYGEFFLNYPFYLFLSAALCQSLCLLSLQALIFVHIVIMCTGITCIPFSELNQFNSSHQLGEVFFFFFFQSNFFNFVLLRPQ